MSQATNMTDQLPLAWPSYIGSIGDVHPEDMTQFVAEMGEVLEEIGVTQPAV